MLANLIASSSSAVSNSSNQATTQANPVHHPGAASNVNPTGSSPSVGSNTGNQATTQAIPVHPPGAASNVNPTGSSPSVGSNTGNQATTQAIPVHPPGAASNMNPTGSSPSVMSNTGNNQAPTLQGTPVKPPARVHAPFAIPSWWNNEPQFHQNQTFYTGVWDGWWSGGSGQYKWTITITKGTEFRGRSSLNADIVQVATKPFLQFIEDTGSYGWACIGRISNDGKTITGNWGGAVPSESLCFELKNQGYPNDLVTL